VLELLALRVEHDRPRLAVGLERSRCSYQPIASASSVSDAQSRANVRVRSGSSPGGSWYWSKPIRRSRVAFGRACEWLDGAGPVDDVPPRLEVVDMRLECAVAVGKRWKLVQHALLLSGSSVFHDQAVDHSVPHLA
jgi:hypothetical protein